jgi:hypothetical protein
MKSTPLPEGQAERGFILAGIIIFGICIAKNLKSSREKSPTP